MKRQYTHNKIMEPEIIAMREQGKTRQEIADALGLTKKQIKDWVLYKTKLWFIEPFKKQKKRSLTD